MKLSPPRYYGYVLSKIFTAVDMSQHVMGASELYYWKNEKCLNITPKWLNKAVVQDRFDHLCKRVRSDSAFSLLVILYFQWSLYSYTIISCLSDCEIVFGTEFDETL